MSKISLESNKARYSDGYGIVPNDAMWEEILLKLPTKGLVRFKAVSKLWYEKISSPSFVKLHLEQSKANTIYIIYSYPLAENMFIMENNGESSQLTLPGFHNGLSSIEICSFNGLLCISGDTEEDDLEIRICNPTTREVTVLPRCSLPGKFSSVGVVFDAETNYKVFRFCCDEFECEDDFCECEVYESYDGTWRNIGQVPTGPKVNWFAPVCPTSVCVQGRLYWLAWNKEDRESPAFVQSVDMEGNFSRISLPEDLNGYTFLINLDGVLSVVAVDDSETYVDILVLEDNKETGFTWSCKACAELELEFIASFNSVVGGKDEILFIFDMFTEFRYRVLNLTERTWRELDVPAALKGRYSIALPFVESLLPCIKPRGETSSSEGTTSSSP
nr:putative F-box protein At1g19160 isoform X1 [Ipomoea batatas]